MKTRIFKVLMLPVAAFALASAGAVTTNASRESKGEGKLMTAYIHNPTINDCVQVQVDCVPGGGQACLSGSWTAFGKDTPVTCNLQLRKP
jgi:hypothetical protein